MKRWVLLLTLLTACTITVEPEYDVLLTAYVLQNIQVDSVDNEVIFRASARPAGRIFWQVDWIDYDYTLDYGQSPRGTNKKRTTIDVPIRYDKNMRFHIRFLAWATKSNTVTVTFMNIPKEIQ